MSTIDERYDRSQRLFGVAGQRKLSCTRVAVGGVSGLGSPMIQHLGLLGVAHVAMIEPQELDNTNRNRFVGAKSTDPVPGSLKVDLAERLLAEINPHVAVTKIRGSIVSPEAFAAIKVADWVIGGFDHDGPRYVLNEVAAAYGKPYVDLASDVPEPGVYGGHVCVSGFGCGCLSCRGILDMKAVQEWLASPEDRAARAAIYGIDRSLLAEEKGPSVSPLNGIIASLGALEFMVAVTGLRQPRPFLNFSGHLGRLTDAGNKPPTRFCEFCNGHRMATAPVDVERYLRIPHLRQAA
jgi:molybdopterin-synthase adenylyltransferase